MLRSIGFGKLSRTVRLLAGLAVFFACAAQSAFSGEEYRFLVAEAEARFAPQDPSQPLVNVRLERESAIGFAWATKKNVGNRMLISIDGEVASEVVLATALSGGHIMIWVDENAETIAEHLDSGEGVLTVQFLPQ